MVVPLSCYSGVAPAKKMNFFILKEFFHNLKTSYLDTVLLTLLEFFTQHTTNGFKCLYTNRTLLKHRVSEIAWSRSKFDVF
jgi:hypothetical protein